MPIRRLNRQKDQTMNDIVKVPQDNEQFSIIEQVAISGDLKQLSSQQRVMYYNRVCESLALNPLTRPFDYIVLNGKLQLYARKDATEQLRKIHNVSITSLQGEFADGLYIVSASALTPDGRMDHAKGAVSIEGLKGEAKANAIMKAETKAKRRVTLSIVGLGWTDESEVDSIPGAQRVTVDTGTGEIIETTTTPQKPLHGHTQYKEAQAHQEINVAPAEPPTRIDVQGEDDFDRALNEIVADDEKLAKAFHATGTSTFGADWNNGARKWLITEYTRAKTPNDIRSSSKDLINSERQALIDDMTKNGKARVTGYAKYQKLQTLDAQTHGHMVAAAA